MVLIDEFSLNLNWYGTNGESIQQLKGCIRVITINYDFHCLCKCGDDCKVSGSGCCDVSSIIWLVDGKPELLHHSLASFEKWKRKEKHRQKAARRLDSEAMGLITHAQRITLQQSNLIGCLNIAFLHGNLSVFDVRWYIFKYIQGGGTLVKGWMVQKHCLATSRIQSCNAY